jgi:hypothetical protein
MKKTLISVCILVFVSRLVLADAICIRISASKPETLPEWLTIKVEETEPGRFQIFLLMAPRQPQRYYEASLICAKGRGAGLHVPISLIKNKDSSHSAILYLPAEIAQESKIYISQSYEYILEDNTLEIDVGSYVDMLSEKAANQPLQGSDDNACP